MLNNVVRYSLEKNVDFFSPPRMYRLCHPYINTVRGVINKMQIKFCGSSEEIKEGLKKS